MEKYSFDLDPLTHQPSGICDFSKIYRHLDCCALIKKDENTFVRCDKKYTKQEGNSHYCQEHWDEKFGKPVMK